MFSKNGMLTKIYTWVEERTGISEILRSQLIDFTVPKDSGYANTLGFVVFTAFFIQLITGVFLLTYYIPHPDYAFKSVQFIMNQANFGWLFRLVHVVGSNLLVATLFIHILVVFYRGTYKKPRELNWLTGGLLFFIILLFCVTGYLLPWNQLSYWSTTILTSIPTVIPLIGGKVTEFIRGGEYVTGITLNRFFAFHVAFLPLFLISIVIIHIFVVWRTGLSSISEGAQDPAQEGAHLFKRPVYPDGYPFYPSLFMKAVFMILLYIAVVFFTITFFQTLFLPEYANIKADPFSTPQFIRPPWYFLAPYMLLRLIPNKFIGISIQVVIIVLFLFWPFFDVNREKNIWKRPFLLVLFSTTLIAWFLLTMLGGF